MVIKTEPNRNICSGRVVVRRGEMLVCCNTFEGVADARWQWQRFVCTGDVRASRDVETAWADKAEFFVADNDLVLTGHPLLHRGDSLLEGERVTMNIQEDYARVVKPRGRMGQSGATPLGRRPLPIPTGALPTLCPIPPLGNR
jgi:lipopolysaccharide transport protein LptA